MKAFSKALTGVAVAVAALASLPAHAVNVTFGGQSTNVMGGDQSGLTSAFVPVSNIANPSSGLFIETFDSATQNPILAGMGLTGTTAANPKPGVTIAQGAGCSINSYGAVALSVNTPGFAVQQGTVSGVGAAPGLPDPVIGDNTCYGFGPMAGQSSPGWPGTATIKVDYTHPASGNPMDPSFMQILQLAGFAAPNDSIGYLGLYYGSIDTYNNIKFYKPDGSLAAYGTGILSDGVIEGSEILALMGGQSGNQQGVGSNVYVNLFFGAGEEIGAFEFSTTGVAYELDNIVVGLASANIPEPESLALVGLGLVGLAAARRRKQAK